MRLEAARIVADWLGDATYGVDAKLAVVTGDDSDTVPSAVATIVDDTRDVNAALGRLDGLTLPAITVSVSEVRYRETEFLQTGGYADADVTVLIRYAERTDNPATARANGCYVVRAILGSLRELHLTAQAASRTRNGVQLVACEGLTEVALTEEVGDAWLVAGVEARYYARTATPMGA